VDIGLWILVCGYWFVDIGWILACGYGMDVSVAIALWVLGEPPQIIRY
jgi:hypothetical protein